MTQKKNLTTGVRKDKPAEEPEPMTVEEWNRQRRAQEELDRAEIRKLQTDYEKFVASTKKSQSTEPPTK